MSCPNNLFEGDTYDTPPGRRSWEDRLLLGNRFHFYLRNFWIFCQTGCCARRGHLTAERQIHYSNGNIRLVEACGGIIHLRGLDHLRQLEGRPVILMGTHMSMLETAVFHAIVRPHLDFTFVIKQSLLKVPFFGWIMQSLAAIPVGRSNPREDLKAVLKQGKQLLQSGRSIILFPQATRSTDFNADSFNSIGVKLAKAAGVEIVPFALKTDFIGNGKYLRDFGPIHRDRQIYFEFGAPVRVEGNGKQELQQLTAFTADRLNRWAQEQAVR
ncbi:1-acyl-sn-glycerol-3-phosphate acyltransferase [Victivallis sp. Marseille-Q1083]|uniref:lysophospholipid acyltransferase family protein n=1 Tax=Victivallis sp. Marseille-Q1083 TaxID=2717288 RepID=UPI00158BDAE9|nr:lysophospholipid acyltransferase family protein [Victivallis sp. Marseille-Q1083]